MDSGYQQALDGAAFDVRTDRGRVQLTGGDAVPFLHALLTNDIAALAPGAAGYAALLTPQGRMISDMEVVRTAGAGAPRVLLSVPADLAARLAARFDSAIFTEDVALEDVSPSTVQFGIVGPAARAAIDAALNAMPESDVVVWKNDALGAIDSFELVAPVEEADGLSARLALHATPLSPEARKTLRVEAGRPEFHVDMTEDTIPLEANLLERAISTTKGCYVGQEVIIRVLHRGGGRVARRLVSLRLDGSTVPDAGATLSEGDREVGRVTSAVWSPRDRAVIALGYVHRDFAREGAALSLPGGRAAVVTAA